VQNLGYADSSGRQVSINASSLIHTSTIENPQYRITAITLSKATRELQILQSVHKHRHESLCTLDYSGVAQRTVGERLTAGSARVFSKMHPK